MKKYLSYGGGINSTACLVLKEQGKLDYDEAVFVDHGTDWPETYEYVEMIKNKFPLTVLKPIYEGYSNLYEYCWFRKMLPARWPRWCTARFKVGPLTEYHEKPCFVMIGIDYGESHRAKISSNNREESRYPLIEAEIDREGCKQIIKDHGLPVPQKSGCYICPFQRVADWKQLRRRHPDLFCKTEQLEKRNDTYRKSKGKSGGYLNPHKKSLRATVDEDQVKLFKEDEYPPCECML